MGPRTNEFSGRQLVFQRDKNRFVLPTGFRKALLEANAREEGNKTFMFLDVHPDWDCLIGFGRDYKDTLAADARRDADMAAQAGRDFNRQKGVIDVSGYERVPYDNGGRFVVPEMLGPLVGIDERIYFRGGTDFFLMWSPEALYAMDSSWKRDIDLCRRMEAQADAKGARK
ncbi:MAG: hypothetical protein KDE32_10875 [Novosphingobium sp.]|nr:hypothetical protein [Novosphingobium sp.]